MKINSFYSELSKQKPGKLLSQTPHSLKDLGLLSGYRTGFSFNTVEW